MPQLNSYEMAQVMYKILKHRRQVSLEDIIAQFEVSTTTAYNVQRALRMICQKHPQECDIQTKNRRTVFVWIENEQGEETQEAEKILNAKPEGE
jgi:hypothetical protein